MSTQVHPFERAGLGKAPFRCVAVTTNWWVSGCGTVRKPGGSCDYCGTGILYEYHIVGADGSTFKVGSDCVAKTGGHQHVDGFKREKSKLLAEKRSAKRKAAWEARQAKWAAEAAAKRVAFDEAQPGLYEALKARGASSGFFADLARGIEKWGALTPRQLEAVNKIFADELARDRLNAGSTHVGTVKGKLTVVATIDRVMSWPSAFYPHAPTYFYVMNDGEHVFTYKGSVYLGGRGETVKLTATVKAHSDYKGTAQTELARPRDVHQNWVEVA